MSLQSPFLKPNTASDLVLVWWHVNCRNALCELPWPPHLIAYCWRQHLPKSEWRMPSLRNPFFRLKDSLIIRFLTAWLAASVATPRLHRLLQLYNIVYFPNVISYFIYLWLYRNPALQWRIPTLCLAGNALLLSASIFMSKVCEVSSVLTFRKLCIRGDFELACISTTRQLLNLKQLKQREIVGAQSLLSSKYGTAPLSERKG